jgi:D-glycero-alpha-D-manno-heptose-7-phosphate kinase
MIICRSPLRITLGGGGTDIPSYYREHQGFLVSAAIDRYVYVTLHRTFEPELIVKYSRLERVSAAHELEHPLIREAFALVGLDGCHLEITSLADIPAGTGLGSSGSFVTALLMALHRHQGTMLSREDLAEQACHIEIERLAEPVGKQDQYIAAFGGVRCFRFNHDGCVETWPLAISQETMFNLEDGLLMFFTGFSRQASSILKEQDDLTKADDEAMLANLHYVKELGLQSEALLRSGDLRGFGDLMHEHWQHKKRRSRNMSNQQIDTWYDLARQAGAIGGKLIGAGGGGFLMFYTEDPARLRRTMADAGLTEVRFRFEHEGTSMILQ